MAGDFLKRKAEEQAKIIDEKYGEGKYGSTSYLKSKIEEAKKTSTSEKSSSTKSGGAKADKSNGKTGDWLKNKAAESSALSAKQPYKSPTKEQTNTTATKTTGQENKRSKSGSVVDLGLGMVSNAYVDELVLKGAVVRESNGKVRWSPGYNAENYKEKIPNSHTPIATGISPRDRVQAEIKSNSGQVKYATPPEEKRTWFSGGAFDDGYQFGDVTKTVVGTAEDIVNGLARGAMSGVEGIANLIMYGGAEVAELFGNDEFAEAARDSAGESFTDRALPKEAGILKDSILGDKSDNILEGVGQLALLRGASKVATGAKYAKYIPTIVQGLSASGHGMTEAYEGGATDGEAWTYGASQGAISAITESFFGGAGKAVRGLGFSRGIGGLDDIFAKKVADTMTKTIKNDVFQRFAGNTIEAAIKSGGEGLEEVADGYLSAVMKKLTYLPDEELKKLIEDENLLEQFVVGAMVSTIAQTPSYIHANKTGTDFVTGLSSSQEQYVNDIAEYKIDEREKSGAKLTNREKNKFYSDVASEVATAPTTLEEAAKGAVERKTKVDGYTMLENRRRGRLDASALDVLTENGVEITADEVRKVTGFGEEGSKLVTRLANQEGTTFSQAVRAVKNAYGAGFTDLKASKVSFVNAVQKAAFDAGKIDRGVQDREAVARAKEATVYEGTFTENEHTKKYTEPERNMIVTFAKALRMDVATVDKIIASTTIDENGKAIDHEANASHQNGKLRISSTAQKILYEMVMHEGGHRMRQLAPMEFGVLMNALYERAARRSAKLGVPHSTSLDSIKAEHDNAGIIMDTSGYLEEFAVRELETIFSSAEEFNNWYAEISGNQKARTGFEKFMDWVHKVIEDIKRTLDYTKMSKAERAEAKRAVAELERIKELYANAFKAAENAATQRGKAQGEQNLSDNATIIESENKAVAVGDSNFSLRKDADAEITKVLNGTNTDSEIKLTDGSPSIMLGHKDVRNLPMTMIASHIRENILTEAEAKAKGLRVNKNINYHGLGKDLFLEVIAGLDNVKEAYRGTPNAKDPTRREKYFLLITQHTDKDGNIINVPVYINEKGLYNRAFIDTNKIATVFGREKLRDYITRQVQNGELVRIKKRSSQTSESASPINAHYGNGTSTVGQSARTDTFTTNNNISQTSPDVKKDFSLKKETSSNVLEKKVETEYNKKTSYSLKNWRTDLNATQFKQVETWLRQIDNHEPKRIADTDACWYKGRIDGDDLFVLYSTATASNPTILYERKGKNGKLELDILLDLLEETENGKSVNGKSAYVSWISGGSWMQQANSIQNNIAGLGAGTNNQNAGVLQGQSRSNASRAFWNVIDNLLGKQGEIIPEESHKNSSLKGGISATELLDTIEGVQNGKTDAKRRLAKYAEDGIVSTEQYTKLVEKYGAIPKGEKPHRDVQVPKKTADNKKVSQTVRTILEAKATPDEALPTIEKMVEDGIFSHEAYSDKKAIKDAGEHLKGNGWTQSFTEWMRDVERGIVSKQHTAMGWALYNNAVNTAAETTSETERREAMETALSVLDGMVRHQRSAAQALQATRILKSLSPETQLYGVQKSVQAFQKELIDKYKDKAPNLKINEQLADRFLKAKTEDERLEIEKEIYKDIGRQMPSRFIDKWNAWRYVSMLANLRTHGKNTLGNAFFAPVVLAKNLTATAIESAVNRVSHKKIVRSKALITGSKADRALLNAAWSDYNTVADIISNGGKYSDSAIANRYIEEGRKIFKTKPLEWARKKNSALLEKEDMWFSKPHYAYALAQYCKANNITAEQIARGRAIAPAREYAIKEAQKATYRDTNAFSQFVSSLGRGGEIEHVPKVVSMAVEGVLPYRKTPANMLVRGVEYSPIGLLKGLTYDLKQVQKGEMEAYEAIDNISAGLTGTGLLALGALLAAQALVRGHGEKEKEEKEFKELMGHQSYALELPNGKSITLDWLAPEALPFFVGVNLWEATKGSKEKVSLSTILQSVTNISEPMLEMSCLQSLNDLGEGIGYASSNDTSFLVSAVSSAVTSYLTQGIPTLFGQAERTGEENRMTTYTEKNGFLTGDMQYTLGKASAKIPLWEYNQIPYIDAWGRKEASGTALKRGFNNFLNPAYTSTVEESKMEKELLRLFDKTGEASVFPKRADKSFKVDGKDKHLTADEYVRYATLKGEKSYKAVTSLVNSSAYKKLTDAEKVKAIADAYDYATQKAKKAISSSYKTDAWISAADEFGTNIGNYLSFKTELGSTKKEKGDSFSKQDVVDIILDTAQNDKEIWLMYLSEYDAKKDVEAHNIGIEGGEYMNVLQNLDKYDEPNKNGKLGTYTNDEIANAISMEDGLTNRERAELWQTMTGSTSTKNNPFRVKEEGVNLR